MFENYKGKIVHYIGGITEYIGVLDTARHPNGKGWIRILNPCMIQMTHQGKKTNVLIGRIWSNDKKYEHFVDLYCPVDSLVEIRVIDQRGILFQTYQKELAYEDPTHIILPNAMDLDRIKRQ